VGLTKPVSALGWLPFYKKLCFNLHLFD
jgi:hypothetical protein